MQVSTMSLYALVLKMQAPTSSSRLWREASPEGPPKVAQALVSHSSSTIGSLPVMYGHLFLAQLGACRDVSGACMASLLLPNTIAASSFFYPCTNPLIYTYTDDLRALYNMAPQEVYEHLPELTSVCSPLSDCLQCWRQLLNAHPDRAFGEYVLEGIEKGFRHWLWLLKATEVGRPKHALSPCSPLHDRGVSQSGSCRREDVWSFPSLADIKAGMGAIPEQKCK